MGDRTLVPNYFSIELHDPKSVYTPKMFVPSEHQGNVLCFLPVYIYAKSSRMPNGHDDFLLVLIVLFCIDVVKLGCAIRNFSQLQILNWCAHWDCRKPTWYFFHEAGVHVLISRSTRHSGIREKGTQGPSPTQRKNRS
ncbi:hypothetical protein BSKO_12194 [Bryopsis sp. KO-2023]|nr:hypothetical protein BSKO_12194 [Bryopsis sp. KO-2023]